MSAGYIEFNANDLTSGGRTVDDGTNGQNMVPMTTPTVTGSTHIEPIPTSGCTWSHIEIMISGQNGNNYDCLLSWDSAGKMPIFSFSVAANKQIATYSAVTTRLDIQPTFPLGGELKGEAGTVYLQIKSDNATDNNIQYARLHWRQTHKG